MPPCDPNLSQPLGNHRSLTSRVASVAGRLRSNAVIVQVWNPPRKLAGHLSDYATNQELTRFELQCTSMIAVDPSVVRGIVGSLGLILLYGFSFWRIFKRNPGNRVIECGSITLMVFAVMMALFRIPNFPTWVVALFGLLVLLLGLLTIFFLLQQGYHALRRRKTS